MGQCFYYWHKSTKVAAWERPSMPVDEDEEDEEEKVWEGEGAETGAPHMATPFTPLVSQPGRAMTPETPVAAQKPAWVTATANSMLQRAGPKSPTGIGGSGYGSSVISPVGTQNQWRAAPRRYLQPWEKF